MPKFPGSGFVFVAAVCAVALSSLAGSAQAQQRQALQSRAAAPASAALIGPMPSSQKLSLALSLPLRNQEQLHTLLQQLEDPTSPNYHQYLTVAQFTEQFGPTVQDFQRIIGFTTAHGLTVTYKAPNRMLLDVSGSVANIEQAFQVTMQLYHHPTENRTFYAPNVEATVEPGLPLLGVGGLSNYVLPHPADLRRVSPGSVHADSTGSGQDSLFLGSDIRAAYAPGVALDGSGQALALAEFGPWNLSDVQLYFTTVSQPLNVPIITELMNGVDGTCPGVPPNGCDDGEEVIDIEQQISLAPNASVMIVYESYGTGHDDLDIFNAYATDNIAKVMSFSFGVGDGNAAADETLFAEMHAQGQNLFIASGDAGATLGGNGWPAYSSNVTDVGGTDLTTNGAGGPWQSETGWVGSGGGWCDSTCSTNGFNLIPTYQAPVIDGSNGGSRTYRNVPDVAAEGNTDNFFCGNGSCGGIGGTSLAAPRFAGFIALANQQAAVNGEAIGFLNTTFYTIGQGSSFDTVFHDITTGSNPSGSTTPPQYAGSFNALVGFDLVTGWGTPNGQGMLNALAPTATNPYFTLSASPATLTLTPGGAGQTSTIQLTSVNGFSGSVNLTAHVLGAPAGITAHVSPTSITGAGTSTLTVSADSSTNSTTFVEGNIEVAVTGSSGAQTQTQAAYVTVGLPDFALSATPSALYLNQSATINSTVAVASEHGFSGSVTLSSVSGLPDGVTAAFNPTIITSATSSTLTFTATSTAATGPSAGLNVTGASGSISQYAPATTLTVNAATGTGGSGTPVNLSSAYNLAGIYADGVTFGTGLDGLGSAYSSTLLTANRILNGVQFNFGPANTTNCGSSPACVNDVVSSTGQTIPLPSGQFTTLQLFATSINGPITSQPLVVNYTDGTSSTFTQSFSDWCSCSGSTPGPGQQSGESYAVVMPYRDQAAGTQDDRPFNLYAYSFVLKSGKTVQSLVLPNKANVLILAATLSSQSLGTSVSLSSEFNIAGLFANGVTFEGTGDIDGTADTDSCGVSSGCSDSYSEQQLGLTSSTPPTLTLKGITYNFGTVNTANCGTGLPACIPDMIQLTTAGVSIALPSNQQTAYTTLSMLGTAVNGSQTGTVTITYTTGSATTINQTFSDWCNFTSNSNESIAVGSIDRINSDGTLATGASCNLYAYTYALDSTRTLQSVTLTYTGSSSAGSGAFVTALTLSGNAAGPPSPGYTLSAGLATPA